MALLCAQASDAQISVNQLNFTIPFFFGKKSYTKSPESHLKHGAKIRYPQSTLIRTANLQHDEKIFNDGRGSLFIHLLNNTKMGFNDKSLHSLLCYALSMPPKHFMLNPLWRSFIHLIKQFFSSIQVIK